MCETQHAVRQRLTFSGGVADVVQQIHDEVQVHQLIIKTVVVQSEQLLVFTAQVFATLCLILAAPRKPRTVGNR